MFGKLIVIGLFEMIQKKKKSKDRVLGSEFGLRAGSGRVRWRRPHFSGIRA